MAWAGWGNTPATKPSYVADRYLAFGYDGQLADLVRDAALPIGEDDATRTPPCRELLGWKYAHPGKPDVTRGTTGPGTAVHPMPGTPSPGSLTLYYPC